MDMDLTEAWANEIHPRPPKLPSTEMYVAGTTDAGVATIENGGVESDSKVMTQFSRISSQHCQNRDG